MQVLRPLTRRCLLPARPEDVDLVCTAYHVGRMLRYRNYVYQRCGLPPNAPSTASSFWLVGCVSRLASTLWRYARASVDSGRVKCPTTDVTLALYTCSGLALSLASRIVIIYPSGKSDWNVSRVTGQHRAFVPQISQDRMTTRRISANPAALAHDSQKTANTNTVPHADQCQAKHKDARWPCEGIPTLHGQHVGLTYALPA